MISLLRARNDFKEWASLFAGNIFVKLAAYVDESGTHEGARIVCVAGLAADVDHWVDFCGQWQTVLNKFDEVPYFHFSEWKLASRVVRTGFKPPSSFDDNPYREWKLEKLDAFLYELAKIAGGGDKSFVGAWVDINRWNKEEIANPAIAPSGGDPIRHCVEGLYACLPFDIVEAWPTCKAPISIFYEQTTNIELKKAVLETHDFYEKRYRPLLGELSFARKTDAPHLPLQAADLVAGRFNQLAERLVTGKFPKELAHLDSLFMGHLFQQIEESVSRFKK